MNTLFPRGIRMVSAAGSLTLAELAMAMPCHAKRDSYCFSGPLLVACANALLLVVSQSSPAAIVEIAVSGRISVNDQWGLLPSEIQTGEAWSGVIRYHTHLVDQDSDPHRGRYDDASQRSGFSIMVQVHGHIFAGGCGELQADVLNDIVHDPNSTFNPPPGDSFSISGPMSQSPRLLDHPSIGFFWNDATGEALSSDEMPIHLEPFEFVQFDTTGTGLPTFSPIYLRIEDAGLSTPTSSISYTVIASIESVELRVVPEPTSQVITALAFSLILFLRTWRRVAEPYSKIS